MNRTCKYFLIVALFPSLSWGSYFGPKDPFLEIAEDNVAGVDHVNKFGRATDVDSGVDTDVWDGADGVTSTDIWVAPTTARTHDITSTSANDTNTAGTGARKVEVQGLDASWAVQTETVNLNGTSNVATANTYTRIFRLKVTDWGNGLENAGIITATAQTDATVTCAIKAGNNQSLFGGYTVPAGKTAYITCYYADFNSGTPSAATADINVLVKPDVDTSDQGYQLKHIRSVSSEFNFGQHNFTPYLKVDAKSDIMLRITGNGVNNSVVSAGFDFILVDN